MFFCVLLAWKKIRTMSKDSAEQKGHTELTAVWKRSAGMAVEGTKHPGILKPSGELLSG